MMAATESIDVVARGNGKRPLTGTDMEHHVLSMLSDRRVWTVEQLYRAIESLGVLGKADRASLPTTAGYKRLKNMGFDITALSAAEKQKLAKVHHLSAEPNYRNAIRQALRQLRPRKGGKGLIESVGRGKVQLRARREASDAYEPPEDAQVAPDYLAHEDAEPSGTERDGGAYVPSTRDSREKIMRSIRARRGQRAFRQVLRARYGDRCVVSGCTLVDILEAAHIVPYRSTSDNHPENGLLLRTDLHTLFDLDLMGIHPNRFTAHFHPAITDATYQRFEGTRLRFTNSSRPSKSALAVRWTSFQERIR
ncbi:HNH endonuclease [Sorangium sp. So ce341]|uniref:HNH endonuclease n=1 Tax=Sorangium sp. So ce341 TaxID=3133302 RepID=UPI003F5E9D88